MEIDKCKNIGSVLAKQLHGIDIHTQEDLERIGSIEAAIRLGISGPSCANKLYALEGAIFDIRWHDLKIEHRKMLFEAYKMRVDEIRHEKTDLDF